MPFRDGGRVGFGGKKNFLPPGDHVASVMIFSEWNISSKMAGQLSSGDWHPISSLKTPEAVKSKVPFGTDLSRQSGKAEMEEADFVGFGVLEGVSVYAKVGGRRLPGG
ncbi:MAG: hypothetical protein JW929_02120 [Anaerolineales bacterium]|nr:hypothetical protein [Anaerolineales bacterium]